jgi:hypothetical protein
MTLVIQNNDDPIFVWLGTILSMGPFPHIDPIPIPAPVWLMKLLSLVTLALHFTAVMLLVGSLVLTIVLDVRARATKDSDRASAAHTLARRLPVIMTWVINLGVPPLLFAQVLYSPAIYSSSVLIGALWASVIPLLMLAYWMLYQTANRSAEGKPVVVHALVALLVVMGIGQIYSMNMTLMLRPEVWQEMYASNAFGMHGAKGDPTITPRWMFVMCGGPMMGGVWALLLANMKHLTDGARAVLRRAGGVSAAVGALLQLLFGYLVVSRQPENVHQALGSNTLMTVSAVLVVATLAGAAALGLLQVARTGGLALGVAGLLAGFLSNAGAAIYRDGLRDITLKAKGFDVWNRVESSNWSVVIVFLLLFVGMIFMIYWLLGVMRKATAPTEQVTI